MLLKQYPSGLRTIPMGAHLIGTANLQVENVREGDPELVELLKLVQIERLEHISSDNKLALIDVARRLFGDFDAFVDYNCVTNPLIHGKDLDFLIDTVDFVNGGIRSLDISTWFNYLDQLPKKPAAIPDNRRISLNRTGSNYIAKWLRQPNGFQDLVATITIMFGIRLTDPAKMKNGLL